MGTHAEQPTVIIWDGSLACLAAARIAEEAHDASGSEAGVIAWVPPPGELRTRPGSAEPEKHVRRAAIEGQHAASILSRVVEWGPEEAQMGAEPLGTVRLLLEAAASALSFDAVRLVWPVAVGEDLSLLQHVTDLAACINTLLLIDADTSGDDGRPQMRIDTPLADLDAPGLEMLAADLGVVVEASAEHKAERGAISPVGPPAG